MLFKQCYFCLVWYMLTLEDTIIWIKVYRYREKKEKIHKNYSKTEFVIIYMSSENLFSFL